MTSDLHGALPENILYFARALRDAGLPVGPASVMDAIAATEAAGLGDRADFRAALHSVLVKKHEHQFGCVDWVWSGYTVCLQSQDGLQSATW